MGEYFLSTSIINAVRESAPKIVVHIFPLQAFEKEESTLDLAGLQNQATKLPLLSGTGYDYKFHYEGYLTFNAQSGNYVQLFRKGYIEAVDSGFFNQHEKKIFATRFESSLMEVVTKYIRVF